jgi:hypothetical protein
VTKHPARTAPGVNAAVQQIRAPGCDGAELTPAAMIFAADTARALTYRYNRLKTPADDAGDEEW